MNARFIKECADILLTYKLNYQFVHFIKFQ